MAQTTEAKVYRFQTERPLIEVPKVVPTISFLTGDAGEEILREYKGRAEKDFGGAKVLNVLNYKDGVVRGSNPFAAALIGQIVRDAGLHIATPVDIQKTLDMGDSLGIRGNHYVDMGLVLRSTEESNSSLAKHLADQLKARGLVEYPVMIPLASVEIVRDADSKYGLSFKLCEDASVFHAPVLNKGGNFTYVDPKTGIPMETCDEGRTLYARDSGLSRFRVNDYLDLNASGDGLNGSSPDGRVAVVREGAEGAEKFEEKLRKEYEAQQRALESKFKDALAVLKQK
jgi:hypothetical protein